ncbi:GntR family transcriptional regulator [Calothrix sp. NIES-4071]|nr:GntR family transcriptional regulator [Calothrix sp. NIES-4071]BAZ63760.1 GntR family transcriptional regulator [Calothrix sp. NIES-4105]
MGGVHLSFPIFINSSASITINAQITEQIKLLIAMGKLRSGDALPTVVQLAKHIGVNHNTIATVYNDLIESGYLVAQRGKGTFVANTQTVQDIITSKELYNLLGKAFNVATVAGLSSSEFAGAAYAQAVMLSQHGSKALKLVFIDYLHNKAFAYEAIKSEIKQDLPFLSLEDLRAGQPKPLEQLLDADLVITTGQHMPEINKLATPEQEINKVDIKPDVKLLTFLALKPRNALVLLVGQQQSECEEMKKMLKQAYLYHVKYITLALENIKQTPKIVEEADVVCVSKAANSFINQYSSIREKVMVFNFSIDERNLLVLKTRLSAIQLAIANL